MSDSDITQKDLNPKERCDCLRVRAEILVSLYPGTFAVAYADGNATLHWSDAVPWVIAGLSIALLYLTGSIHA